MSSIMGWQVGGLLAIAVAAAAMTSEDTAWEVPGLRSFSAPGRAENLRSATRWTSADCQGCHDMGMQAFSHPVGVRPLHGLPPSLPLESGKVACVTCHDIDSSAEHEDARRTHQPRLRIPDGETGLCIACHDPGSSDIGDIHAIGLGRAHFAPAARRRGTVNGPLASAFSGLDPETAACVTCHDGSFASAQGHGVSSSTRLSGRILDHPIGVSYTRRRGQGLHPESQLTEHIRLFDGQVGCGSCHAPYSGEPNLLVMSNDRSQLCLSCHDM